MKKLFLSSIVFFTLSGMEMQEDEIRDYVPSTLVPFIQSLEYFNQQSPTPMHQSKIDVHDIPNPATLWDDIIALQKAITKKDQGKVTQRLHSYSANTETQLHILSRYIPQLNNQNFHDITLEYLEEESSKEFFKELFCKDTSLLFQWLSMRIIALQTVQDQLKNKTNKEKCIDMTDQGIPCTNGFCIGSGLLLLPTWLWPLGVGLMLGGCCICGNYQTEFYRDHQPSRLFYQEEKEIINEKIQRCIQNLLHQKFSKEPALLFTNGDLEENEELALLEH